MPRLSGRPSRTASRKSTPYTNTAAQQLPKASAPTASAVKSIEKGLKSKGKESKEAKTWELTAWEEPPLAAPLPSYKDYDINNPSNSSTVQMQPLGTLPPTKLTGKSHKKRESKVGTNGFTKAAAGAGTGGGIGTKENNSTRGSAPPNSDPDTTAADEISRPTTPSTLEPRRIPFGDDVVEELPNSKTPVGRQRLSAVVHAAVERSALVGNVELGRAIKRLYEDSMTNNDLQELLDAVLAQTATPEQKIAFQAHIRTARESLAENSPGDGSPSQNTSGTNNLGLPTPTVTKALLASTGAGKGKKGRRSSRRLTEDPALNRVSSDASSDMSTLSSSGSVLENPPFPGGPSEPSTPPATENYSTSSKANAKSQKNQNKQATTSEGFNRYDELTEQLRQKMPKDDDLILESGVRFREGQDDAAPLPVGVSTRASARKEIPNTNTANSTPAPTTNPNSNPRKRARSPEPPTTPPPIRGSNAPSILDPPDLGFPPKKKRQTRVKTSPMKSKTGPFVLAGVGNSTAESSTRDTRYASEAVSENDDLCCVCNGPGKFLCCDRCPKSFHFTCINPPIDENSIPEDAWYCRKCTIQMNPPPKQPRGLFASSMDELDRKNPVSFSLPDPVKTYFQGVQAGPNGEYMEQQDTKPTKRGGFAEELDPLRTKDKNGQLITCYKCGLSTLGQKKIVACEFCPLYWHLDCLNPPLANPPPQVRKWMCPAHAEQGLLQPRRPRNAKVVDTLLRRGHKNNGYIEIENSDSEDEVQFVEHESGGIIYRLPERGIKLDFVDKIKATKLARKNPFGDLENYSDVAKRRRIDNGDSTVPVSRELSVDEDTTITDPSMIIDRPYEEVDTVQSLLNLARTTIDSSSSVEELDNLINALLIEAPPAVRSMMPTSIATTKTYPLSSQLPPTHQQPPFSPADSADSVITVSEHERKQLFTIIELCQKRLALLEGREMGGKDG